MADYYTVLAQKIQETRDDPVKIREVVYEAARLALRWQVQERWPGLSIIQSKSHIRELEDAIARLEADAVGPGGRDSRESAKAAAGLKASRRSRNAPVESEQDDTAHAVAEAHPQPRGPPPAEPADVEGRGGRRSREPGKAAAGLNASGIESGEEDAAFRVEAPRPQPWVDPLPAGQADFVGSRELNLAPVKRAYLVNPADFVNPELTHRLPAASHSGARVAGAGLMIAFQLAVATLAVAAFCVAMWGRDSPVQTLKETPTAATKPPSARPTGRPNGSNAVVAPLTPAPLSAASADGSNAVVAAPLAAAPVDGSNAVVAAPLAAATLSFPRPTSYGVYAISDNRLIELEQVQATPVDRRAGDQLQIVEPGRSVMASGKLAFVAFRRDLVSNAPEKVPLHIAARVARSMNFDSAGKAVMTTPATETWIIRDQGYNLRVSPLRENAEMVMLRSEDPEFSFPSGRYELMLGGQVYDFVVAGEVTDPAHCVEGVSTVRGPVFYECKPVL
jgi:hypothetical protein